ncbi:MAG: 30S ribosomal protein S2 [Actinomycetota bacterium]
MPVVTRRELLEAGVHFGHQTRRWNPKMQRFLYGERSGIYIIDLEKSLSGLEETHEFVQGLGRRRGIVLFIGTKKQAQEVVQDHAIRIGMPYVNHRWLGGMLTNFTTISKRLLRLRELHEMERTGAIDFLPKKEAIRLRHERDKLTRNLGGIQDLERLPDAVFVIDTKKEHIAVNEARKLGIPVIAIVDTNCDPDEVDFVIPGNDDAIRAVSLVTRVIADALAEGYGMAKDEDVERVTARRAAPAAAGPRSTAAPARVEESETPSAEDAAKIAASTVFEPDAPEAPAPEGEGATDGAETAESAVSAEGAEETENPEATGSAEPFEAGTEETREPSEAPEGASGTPEDVVVAEPVEAVAAAVPDTPQEPA